MVGQNPPLRLHICVSHHHLSLEHSNISASTDEMLATHSKHPHTRFAFVHFKQKSEKEKKETEEKTRAELYTTD